MKSRITVYKRQVENQQYQIVEQRKLSNTEVSTVLAKPRRHRHRSIGGSRIRLGFLRVFAAVVPAVSRPTVWYLVINKLTREAAKDAQHCLGQL
jgi:hypothetical protein